MPGPLTEDAGPVAKPDFARLWIELARRRLTDPPVEPDGDRGEATVVRLVGGSND